MVVKEICTQQEIQEGEIEMTCDNIEALRQAVDLDYFTTPRHTHFNFTTAIQLLVKESPLEWKV